MFKKCNTVGLKLPEVVVGILLPLIQRNVDLVGKSGIPSLLDLVHTLYMHIAMDTKTTLVAPAFVHTEY